MKILSLLIVLTFISCAHKPGSREIASTTPILSALVKALAKETKTEVSKVAQKMLMHLKGNAADYGILAATARSWKSLDDIPNHLRRSLNKELFYTSPRIFKLSEARAKEVLKRVERDGNKISKLQKSIFESKAGSSSHIKGRRFERTMILSAYKENKMKVGYGSTFDALMKNAVTKQERALAKQIMTQNAEIYATTGHKVLATAGCKELGGLSVYQNLNRTIARVAEGADSGIIKTKDDIIEAIDQELAVATNRTMRESKHSRCILSRAKIPGGNGKACRILDSSLAIGCK